MSVSAAVTTITCLTPSEGIRLAQLLAKPLTWTGVQPSSIEGNGASVMISWPAAVVSSTVQTAVTAAKPNGMAVSASHSASGSVTQFQL